MADLLCFGHVFKALCLKLRCILLQFSRRLVQTVFPVFLGENAEPMLFVFVVAKTAESTIHVVLDHVRIGGGLVEVGPGSESFSLIALLGVIWNYDSVFALLRFGVLGSPKAGMENTAVECLIVIVLRQGLLHFKLQIIGNENQE